MKELHEKQMPADPMVADAKCRAILAQRHHPCLLVVSPSRVSQSCLLVVSPSRVSGSYLLVVSPSRVS